MRKEQFCSVTLYQGDCMEYMAGIADKGFDLAIVDPPYGLGDKKLTQGGTWASKHKKGDCAWDVAPSSDYFLELQRASKNWIVWGGNYFSHELPAARCFIVWRKLQMLGMHTMADCELALTSFDKNAKIWDGNNAADRIHPTQKPKELYDWLLHNYAKPEQRIFDTHLGSGSSAIAAYYFGCEFVGVELDPDYFDAACRRIELATKQGTLF
jgi:site-specific DNA-methyltransferase (adenine-specific)